MLWWCDTRRIVLISSSTPVALSAATPRNLIARSHFSSGQGDSFPSVVATGAFSDSLRLSVPAWTLPKAPSPNNFPKS